MPASSEQFGDLLPNGPAAGGIAVTTSDTTELTRYSRHLFVGGAGNLSLLMRDDSTVTMTGVLAGSFLPLRVKRVNATGTTATNIVAFY